MSSSAFSKFFSLPPQTIAEFDLGAISYEVKSAKCHELSLAAPPHDHISFNFRCEQEAQGWATVLMSSLREAQRGQSPHWHVLTTFLIQINQIVYLFLQRRSFLHFGDVGRDHCNSSLYFDLKERLCCVSAYCRNDDRLVLIQLKTADMVNLRVHRKHLFTVTVAKMKLSWFPCVCL